MDVDVYADYDEEARIGVVITDKKWVVIFDTATEVPLDFYKEGGWYRADTSPEAIGLANEAMEIIMEEEEKGGLSELPQDIRELVRGRIPDEFLEMPDFE